MQELKWNLYANIVDIIEKQKIGYTAGLQAIQLLLINQFVILILV
ncbi:MAG: hypothetical protein ACFFDW_17065 [Candidatus Thorarchaeota archaeon]